MAQRPSTIRFEGVPLDEARRMGRAPHMNPEIYHALKLMTAGLKKSVTVRKVHGGLLFWRSTDDDRLQA